MALKQAEDHYNSLSPAEREAYKRKYYPKTSSAIDRLSSSIENDHAYMSDAEWEVETIARMRRWREQQHIKKSLYD